MGLGCTDVLGARHGERWGGECACGRGEVARGSAIRGLGGMARRRGMLVRLYDKKGGFRGFVNPPCEGRGYRGELLRVLDIGIPNL
jgi:hypothetical protein